MKKFKSLLAIFLAVAVACTLMVAPVSASVAVPYANYSASDRGTNANCPWNSSLVTSAKVATAEITVKTRTSGVQPAFLAASLEGMVYTSRGYTVSLSGEDSIEAAPLLTVSDSCNVSDYSYYAINEQNCRNAQN